MIPKIAIKDGKMKRIALPEKIGQINKSRKDRKDYCKC
jgi:hypothetical protein